MGQNGQDPVKQPGMGAADPEGEWHLRCWTMPEST